MVSNSSGFQTLGLVSQGDITSSASGTAFTFAGINEVALIALAGSIDLSGISFANFHQLFIYARGSSGDVTMAAPISNVTLTSPTNILAAKTINISQGVVVTINSAQQADVFTDNPNYFGFGGTGTPVTSGTFGGAGAKNPQPLANAPPLGDAGHGP